MKQHIGAYYTGNYRNVFQHFGYSKTEIETKLHHTWNQLFFGDENTKIYYETDCDLGYMLDTGNLDVRTEGMSYGMMMAVQMDNQDVFDRLWRWSMKYMYMTDGENAGYFAWSCSSEGKKNAYGPAPDGEEYFALALFFASHRWGDRLEFPFNYSEQAKTLLHTCIHKGEDGIGYPMWNPNNKLIKFIPNCEYSDPSYHLPHFYELFSLWADESDKVFWQEAATASRTYLQLACHPKTGLSPEYAYYDGTPNDERGFGHFFSDSYRTAGNIGLDYEWFGKDKWQTTAANNIQAFFSDKDPDDYRRYTICGNPFEEKSLHPVGLIATNAMASLASINGPYAKSSVDLFWNTPVRTGVRRYYDNCLYLFAMLALSGNFKIWMPELKSK